MATPKISTFVIALVWVSFFAAIFGSFLGDVATNYNLNDSSVNVDTFNKLEELDTEVESYKESALAFKENTGITDIIGAYFTNAYRTMKVTLGSLDIFTTMTNDALNSQGMDIPAMQYFKTSIIITVLVFLIIGVLLSAILKKDV